MRRDGTFEAGDEVYVRDIEKAGKILPTDGMPYRLYGNLPVYAILIEHPVEVRFFPASEFDLL